MDLVPLIALRDSLDPPRIPDGTCYLVQWIREQVVDDDNVFQMQRRYVRARVAHTAGCAPESVTVVEFGPNVLAAKYEQHRHPFSEPFPDFLIGCTALVGYVIGAVPVEDRDGPLCSVCAGDLASATGVCITCGHDEMGYYSWDDDDDEYVPDAEHSEALARLHELLDGFPREQLAELSDLGKQALG